MCNFCEWDVSTLVGYDRNQTGSSRQIETLLQYHCHGNAWKGSSRWGGANHQNVKRERCINVVLPNELGIFFPFLRICTKTEHSSFIVPSMMVVVNEV